MQTIIPSFTGIMPSTFTLDETNLLISPCRRIKSTPTTFRPRTMTTSSFRPEHARSPPDIPMPAPLIEKFKVGICQLPLASNKERNIAHARGAIEKAVARGAKLVVLPEEWNVPVMFSIKKYAEDIDAGGDASPSTAMLSEVSRRLKITIIGGSIMERSGDKFYNTCCVFGPNGNLLGKHRKLHIYDVGAIQESKMVTAGESLTIVDTDVGRIGLGICYDMAFPEIATIYTSRGAHLICYVCAFDLTMGQLFWESAQKSRAHDNQVYVVTCSRARDTQPGYVAWGHSSLIAPFGEVLATTGHEEDIIIAEIDYSTIEEKRSLIPLRKHSRGDLYQLVDIQRLNSK